MPKIENPALHNWRIARRISLGAIVIAGTMATAAAVANRVADYPCHARAHHGNGHGSGHDEYSYSGIGVELTQDGTDFVVARVFPGTPADGKLQPGAILLTANGEQPANMQDWTHMIRGEKGSEVELEVVYPCSGHETVVIERDLVVLNERHFAHARR